MPTTNVFDAMEAGPEAKVLAMLRAQPRLRRAHTPKGTSVLMRAAMAGFLTVAEDLLAHGADVNERRSDGFTALFFAVLHSRAAMVRRLLAAGADPTMRAKMPAGRLTPLELAQRRDDPRMVKALRSAGPPTADAVRLAAANGEVGPLQKLLEALPASAVDEPDGHGRTALWLAAQAGHLGCVALLTERGADVNARPTKAKQSVLDVACDSHRVDVVEHLVARGATVTRARRPTLVDWARAHFGDDLLRSLGEKKPGHRGRLSALDFAETTSFLRRRGAAAALRHGWPSAFERNGRALVFHQDTHWPRLRLDHGETLAGPSTPRVGPGVVIDGDLTVDTIVQNGEQDFGPFLVVLGDLHARDIAVGGALLFVAGSLFVEGVFHGYYNHGATLVQKDLHAALVLPDDYSLTVKGRIHAQVYEARGHVTGRAPPPERPLGAVIARRFLRPSGDGLQSHRVYDALVRNKPLFAAPSNRR